MSELINTEDIRYFSDSCPPFSNWVIQEMKDYNFTDDDKDTYVYFVENAVGWDTPTAKRQVQTRASQGLLDGLFNDWMEMPDEDRWSFYTTMGCECPPEWGSAFPLSVYD